MRESLYSTAKEFAVYGLGSTLMQVVSVLLIPVYTRWLGVDDYGVLSLLTGIQTVLVTLAQSGLGSAFFRSYYDYTDEGGQQRVISTTMWLLVSISTLVAICTFLFADQVATLVGIASITGLQIRLIALITFFEGLNNLPFSVFRARRQPVRYVATSLIVLLARLSMIIYFVVGQAAGLQGVLLGMLIGAGCSFVLGYVQILGSVSLYIRWPEVKKLLRFGMPLIPANLAGWVLEISGRYFLVSAYAVGIYALADRFSSVLSVLLVQPIFLLWLPVMLSVFKQEYAQRFFSRVFTYYVIGGISLSLLFSLFARELLLILATSDFIPSRYYVFPLCLAKVFYGASRLLNVGTDLARKSENGALALIIAVMVFAILGITLIPVWGIGGLVFAVCVAYFVMSGLTFLLASRLYQVRYEWGQVIIVLVWGCAIYGISIFLESLQLSLLLIAIIKLVLLAAFPAFLLISGIITAQERSEVNRQYKRIVHFVQNRSLFSLRAKRV